MLGCHDFALLGRLVFPDGTVPRCLHYALPTRDCMFKNPLFDQEIVLKIWNLNKFGGIIGAFNCQGAGWDPAEHRVQGYSHCYKPASGNVQPADVEWGQREYTSNMANALLTLLQACVRQCPASRRRVGPEGGHLLQHGQCCRVCSLQMPI